MDSLTREEEDSFRPTELVQFSDFPIISFPIVSSISKLYWRWAEIARFFTKYFFTNSSYEPWFRTEKFKAFNEHFVDITMLCSNGLSLFVQLGLQDWIFFLHDNDWKFPKAGKAIFVCFSHIMPSDCCC